MIRTLLLSCYELGHQPLSLAWPLAALHAAGLPAAGIDLAVEPFSEEAAARARFIGISVPMLTAMRLGVEAARRIRQFNPGAHLCFYGHYAWLNGDYLLDEGLADSVIAGEYETTLVELVRALERGANPSTVPGARVNGAASGPRLVRQPYPVPRRQTLPPITEYARLMRNGTAYPAGYTETTRGCLHTCRHCPVVPIYRGRLFAIPLETILADVRQQVAAGARHITFGDPDFLNGPGHARRVARALHAEFPALTFDFTAKVEHLLKHRTLLPELCEMGALFVIAAFESVSERVLTRLHKGHTAADLDTALEILAGAGLPVQPTWVPFTPWTTLEDYLQLLQWIRTRGLIQHIPLVQLSIRLLIPPGSALLEETAAPWLGALDAANFTHRWQHPDPRVDTLQKGIAVLAELQADADPYTAFAEVERAAYACAGQAAPAAPMPPPRTMPAPPRLTEDWFC